MEPLAQPPDNLDKPKRRWRWWLVTPLLLLLVLATSAWFVWKSGGAPPYEFLKGMQMVRDTEWIHSYPPDPDEWVSMVRYRSDLSLLELSERAKSELVDQGFIWDKKPGTPLAFLHSSKGIYIFVLSEQSGNDVLIRRKRKANVLDRARIWLNGFSRSEATRLLERGPREGNRVQVVKSTPW